MHSTLTSISTIGIVPVLKIEDATKAVPLAKALKAGGIPCAEVAFRTAQSAKAMANIANEVPDILLGAGTVLTVEQVDMALAAGAQFIVSPGFNPEVVSYCVKKGIPITPGCTSPSEMEQAIALGLTAVKFFPAEQSGGLAYLKAMAGPFSQLQFMPTGGINAENVNTYLAYDKVLACGGSWMAPSSLIEKNDFEKISQLCKQAVHSMLQFHLAHIGINAQNQEEALQTANAIHSLFGFTVKEGNSSVFTKDCIEIMNSPYRGKNGHIAIGVTSVERAKAYLQSQGHTFAEDTVKVNSAGKIVAIYLENEIADFAFHLVRQN